MSDDRFAVYDEDGTCLATFKHVEKAIEYTKNVDRWRSIKRIEDGVLIGYPTRLRHEVGDV